MLLLLLLLSRLRSSSLSFCLGLVVVSLLLWLFQSFYVSCRFGVVVVVAAVVAVVVVAAVVLVIVGVGVLLF